MSNDKTKNADKGAKGQDDSGKPKAPANRKRTALIVGGVILGIIVVILAAALIFLEIGKNNLLHPEGYTLDNLEVYEEAQSSDKGRTVTYKGHKYQFNDGVIPICIMGRDKGLHDPGEDFNGQADAIMVLTVNTRNNDINGISIPRDSMVDSSEGFHDTFEGTSVNADKMQLCLVYAYGENDEQSSKFMMSSVSDLLFGIPIDNYCTLDVDGLGDLADLAGGVTLEALYTIPPTEYSTDMPIEAGQTVTLSGGDALRYVQYRDITRSATALERLERQRQFVSALGKQLASKLKSNPGAIFDVMSILQNYSTTNLGLPEVCYLASVAARANMDNVDTTRLMGQAVRNSESLWEQYYVDEASTYQTVLDAFYTRMD